VSAAVQGACLCGAVEFSIAPPYRWFAHCHCSMCRKHSGSLFGSGLGVARAAFVWLRGASTIVRYRATRAFERPFCRECGSTVPGASHDESYWHVPAGLLEGDLGARPRSQIFTASRSPLAELDDTLPRHDSYPPGIDLPLAAAPRQFEPGAALAGSCLCGSVAFAAAALPPRVLHCHCSLCRKRSGAPFTSTLLVPRAAFRWLRGGERIARWAAPAPRRYLALFCADCGSPVPHEAPDARLVALPAGAVDTPLPRLPAAHAYVGSKADWYEIRDSWPRFVAAPPDVLEHSCEVEVGDDGS
jgi:hypothetical protein